MSKNNLKVIPLGGLGEFGMNAMILQSGNSAIMIDCGSQFSDGRHLGIEVIIPDFSYIYDPSLDLKAILLTHGHEDHIGSIPFILARKQVPIYGPPFALELVKSKLQQAKITKADLRTVKRGTTLSLDPFKVEWIEMAHSIPDAFALAIDTPQGMVIHTGDFKIDDHTPDGKKTDLKRLGEIAKEKSVLLLCADSTNVEVPGKSISEQKVSEALTQVSKQTKGWLVITTFASHIPRVSEIFRIAQATNRKIHAVGRTMVNNIGIARKLGLAKFPDNVYVEEQEALSLPRHKVLLLVTGSQAEPRSALTKIALNNFKKLKLMEGDRVVFSSRAIPGHERSIYHLYNHIYRTGAEVVSSQESRVHVSGHGYREDLRLIHQIVKPKYFLPVHGELKMLVHHKKLAIEEGMAKDHILMMENGDCVEFTNHKAKFLEKLSLEPKLVDPPFLVGLDSHYLKDRKKLAERGVMTIVCVFDRKSGKLVGEPVIEDFGFIVETERESFMNRLFSLLEKHLNHVNLRKMKDEDVEEDVRALVSRVCKNEFNRKPVILSYIITV